MLDGAAAKETRGSDSSAAESPGPLLKRVKVERCEVDVQKRVQQLEAELAMLKALPCSLVWRLTLCCCVR